MTDSLRAAFENACYRVRIGAQWRHLHAGARHPRIDRRLRALGCHRRWHLITACNPEARSLPDAENARRQRQLRDDLARLGLRTRDSIASDADGQWREPGYVVFDGDDAVIEDLARRHGQLALLSGRPGGIAEVRWL